MEKNRISLVETPLRRFHPLRLLNDGSPNINGARVKQARASETTAQEEEPTNKYDSERNVEEIVNWLKGGSTKPKAKTEQRDDADVESKVSGDPGQQHEDTPAGS